MTYSGYYGPRFKTIPKAIQGITKPLFRWFGERRNFYCPDSSFANKIARSFHEKLAKGETIYIVGIGPAGHNSGIALIKVNEITGIELIANYEEERFTGIKHCDKYPSHSVEQLKLYLQKNNLSHTDIHCVVASWDYISMIAFSLKTAFEHMPNSFALFKPSADPEFNLLHMSRALNAPRKLANQFGLSQRFPIIGMPHHKNHAYFSYAASPFSKNKQPTLITVLDGTGDNGAISLYLAKDGKLTCLRQNQSIMDSLGVFYGFISATQGGWSFLSSEGRYMGAAAWGNMNRFTNSYYRRLREIFHFADHGNIYVNRKMVNWHNSGQKNCYKKALQDILGDPIPKEKMWNPDAVLNVDNIAHSDITVERVDKAAAVQMVFEDTLFHIVDHLIRTTSADQLVLTGGTALNCVANMRLLQHFDASYYQRYLNQSTRLHIWVPPTPGDAGVTIGATYQFAMVNGGNPGKPMQHAFYCGHPPDTQQIVQALHEKENIGYEPLGNINQSGKLENLADFMAKVVANNGVIGIYQGAAETGPRALGHRSILANPCNPKTLELLNAHVKLREKIRPLAPMVTLETAKALFELAPGAAMDDYNAYNYMVLTVYAKEAAKKMIPATVHYDGTSRIQIVRPEIDSLIYAYLKAMGKHVGVEASINTSLNVGSPIVQTPNQALDVLFRAKDLDGLLLVSAEGDVFVAWPQQNQAKQSKLSQWPREHKADVKEIR